MRGHQELAWCTRQGSRPDNIRNGPERFPQPTRPPNDKQLDNDCHCGVNNVTKQEPHKKVSIGSQPTKPPTDPCRRSSGWPRRTDS